MDSNLTTYYLAETTELTTRDARAARGWLAATAHLSHPPRRSRWWTLGPAWVTARAGIGVARRRALGTEPKVAKTPAPLSGQVG